MKKPLPTAEEVAHATRATNALFDRIRHAETPAEEYARCNSYLIARLDLAEMKEGLRHAGR